MRKFPIRLAWDFIGDFYKNYIIDDDRRKFEAFWQALQDQSAEILAYADYYQRARSPFDVEPYAPWGNFKTSATLIDLSNDVDGFIVGLRNGYWVFYSESANNIVPFGSFRLFDSAEEYSTVTTEGETSYLVALDATQTWDVENNPSFAFGQNFTDRFETIGSVGPETGTVTQGIRLKPQWVNWVILQDKFWLDGGQNWSQKWRMKVENWDNSPSLRSISVNSFGDAGPSYEIRLLDDGSEVRVGFGKYASTRRRQLEFSGNTITRTRGNFVGDGYEAGMSVIITDTELNNTTVTVTSVSATQLTVEESLTDEITSTAILTAELNEVSGDTSLWRGKLLGASQANPVEVVFDVSYNAASSSILASVRLDGQQVSQTQPFDVMPGRRKNLLDVFNQYRDVDIVLDYVYGTGRLFEQTEQLDFSTDIGFGFIYEVPEPIVDGNLIQTEPWPLAPEADVVSQDATAIVVEVDEDWNGYAPQFVKITQDGQFISGEKTNQSNSTVTYNILKRSKSGLELSGGVRLRPWFTDDITWIAESQFATSEPLPTDSIYIQDSKAIELDMYNRYGKMLNLPNLPDSQEYLDAIRGTQFALLKPATYRNLSNAISAIIGVPYSNRGGFITSINRVTNNLGKPLYDEVNVSGRVNRVSPFWADQGLLLNVGQEVSIMGSLVNQSVNVFDWKNNPEFVQSKVSTPWEQWGTVVFQLPAIFATTPVSIEIVRRALDASLSIHSNYLLEYYSSESEDMGGADRFDRKFDRMAYQNLQYSSVSEDLAFGDLSGVANNDLNLQYVTAGGANFVVSEEFQQSTDYTLDDGLSLDTELGLGTLLKPKLKLIDGDYYIPEMVDMKSRPLGASETFLAAHEFNKYDPNKTVRQGPKPYEITWAYEGSTDVLANDSSSWRLLTVPGGSHFDAYIEKELDDVAYISGDLTTGFGGNGAIFRSNDGGKSFTLDLDSGSSGVFFAITRNFAFKSGALWERIDGVWEEATPASWTSIGFSAQVMEYAQGITYAVGTVSSQTYLSIHDGTSWSAPTSIFATGGGPIGMHVPDANTIWIPLQTGDRGLLRSLDGGQTWDHFLSGVQLAEAHQYRQDTIIVSQGGFGSSTYVASNPFDPTPTFNIVAGAPSLRSMDCVNGYVYGCTASQIFYSTDGGFNWIDDTPSSPATTLVRCEMNQKIRLVIGDGEIWVKR